LKRRGGAADLGTGQLLSRYDVIARVPAGAAKEQIPLMLQTLLADRFKLALHHEQKTMQVYALEVPRAVPSGPLRRLRERRWPQRAIA